jgi:hypothetical protein
MLSFCSTFTVHNGKSDEKWEEIGETVQIPAAMFSGACASYDTNVVFSMYDNFPDSGLKNPV